MRKIKNDESETLLTETDVADVLNVKISTLQRWRWQGVNLPYVKIGSAVRYKPSDIKAYVAASTRRSTSDRPAASDDSEVLS